MTKKLARYVLMFVAAAAIVVIENRLGWWGFYAGQNHGIFVGNLGFEFDGAAGDPQFFWGNF